MSREEDEMLRVEGEMPPVLWRKLGEPGLAAALQTQLVLFCRHSEVVEMVVMYCSEILQTGHSHRLSAWHMGTGRLCQDKHIFRQNTNILRLCMIWKFVSRIFLLNLLIIFAVGICNFLLTIAAGVL